MRKAYKYKLYPTTKQCIALDGQLGEACRLYNSAIEERRNAYKAARKSINYYDQAEQLKEIRANNDLGLENFSACQDVLRRVDKTFKAFFNRIMRGDKAGFPRFRSRSRFESITFPSYGDGCKLRDDGRLYLQGVGCIKVKQHRAVEGKIKTVTVKREVGRWYVCFSVEGEAALLPAIDNAVGIDVGLKSFAVLSDGSHIDNPRHYRKAQARLRKAQRKVARRKKGGNRRRKAIQHLQRAHAHVRNQRADFQHKASDWLVKNHQYIFAEDLNIKGLAGGMLAKSVHYAGWGMFLAMVAYKAENAGRIFMQVNPKGTSQVCSGSLPDGSHCRTRVVKGLSQRWHSCPCCGLEMDRDENAALNILRLGLSLAALTWAVRPCVAAEAVCFS